MEENERREGVLKQHFALYAKKPSIKDCFVTVFIFMICTIIGLLFQKLHFTDTNIVTIYILGVLITSILTDGYLCSIAGSFLSVVLFCFFLTEPRMSFQTYAVGYPVTFAIMLVCSVLANAGIIRHRPPVAKSEEQQRDAACHLHAAGSFTEPGYCCIYCRRGKIVTGTGVLSK